MKLYGVPRHILLGARVNLVNIQEHRSVFWGCCGHAVVVEGAAVLPMYCCASVLPPNGQHSGCSLVDRVACCVLVEV